jgi:hypothetical protein
MSNRRHEAAEALPVAAARLAKALVAGTLRAALRSRISLRITRRTSHGSGSTASIHHQASVHMSSASLALFALRGDPFDA